MNYLRLEHEILSSVKSLNGNQQSELLNYIKHMVSERHSTKIYRRKAMKEIRKALETA